MEPNEKRKVVFEKEDAFKTLELTNGWIGSMDTKASFLLAYLAVVMGFVVSNGLPSVFKLPVPKPLTTHYIAAVICVIALYLFLVFAVISLLETLIARTKNNSDRKSMLFFGEIATLSLNDFKAKILNRTEDELIKDLLEQVHTNSKICVKKSAYYNWGVRFTFLSTVLYIACMLLEVF